MKILIKLINPLTKSEKNLKIAPLPPLPFEHLIVKKEKEGTKEEI